MGETFTIVFKDGPRLKINYPKDSLNPFKARQMAKATIGNVTSIEGSGPVASTLRKKYGLSEEKEISTLDLLAKTSGLSREELLKKKDKVQHKLESLRKRFH